MQPGVLDDAVMLDRITRCLNENDRVRITLDGITDVGRAQQVAAALEQRGVAVTTLEQVTFAGGLRLCAPADTNCWTRRASQLGEIQDRTASPP